MVDSAKSSVAGGAAPLTQDRGGVRRCLPLQSEPSSTGGSIYHSEQGSTAILVKSSTPSGCCELRTLAPSASREEVLRDPREGPAQAVVSSVPYIGRIRLGARGAPSVRCGRPRLRRPVAPAGCVCRPTSNPGEGPHCASD